MSLSLSLSVPACLSLCHNIIAIMLSSLGHSGSCCRQPTKGAWHLMLSIEFQHFLKFTLFYRFSRTPCESKSSYAAVENLEKYIYCIILDIYPAIIVVYSIDVNPNQVCAIQSVNFLLFALCS